MPRVAGCDPGTSSLDIVVLEEGRFSEEKRFSADELASDPTLPVQWLNAQTPFDLIVGPSGYGLPFVHASDCTESERQLMSLVRPDERGTSHGVRGFSGLVRALCASRLDIVFLPGVIHLPTVPDHRKFNRIDLGTPDKLCATALALWNLSDGTLPSLRQQSFCLVEMGSAFTACIVVKKGQIVDGVGGTCGPMGGRSSGAWDGEVAYLYSPLKKQDLFNGGIDGSHPPEDAVLAYTESIVKCVAGLQAVHGFDEIVLSGSEAFRKNGPIILVKPRLRKLAHVTPIHGIKKAKLKHAAQGAALLADGLCNGSHKHLITCLGIRESSGTVLDWIDRNRIPDGFFG